MGRNHRHLGWGAACRAERRTSAGWLDGALRVYVSSRSVYREPVALGADEHAPVVDAASNALDGSYAGLKAGGEQAAQELFGERALIARVGLILGPGEDIGRLPWWLQRVARGGQVLAPAPADLPLQYIDVRDLVTWLLDRGRERVGGTFNVVSRAGRTRQGCAAARWRGRSPTLGSGLRTVGGVPPRAGRPQRAQVGLDPAREAELLATA